MVMTSETPQRLLRGVNDRETGQALMVSFANAEVFRQSAVKYLQRQWESAHNKTFNYDNPSWSHLQAHCNGEMELIEDILLNVFGIGGRSHAPRKNKKEASKKEASKKEASKKENKSEEEKTAD